jgi:hypothetical protein
MATSSRLDVPFERPLRCSFSRNAADGAACLDRFNTGNELLRHLDSNHGIVVPNADDVALVLEEYLEAWSARLKSTDFDDAPFKSDNGGIELAGESDDAFRCAALDEKLVCELKMSTALTYRAYS